jgi:hypothetical protein
MIGGGRSARLFRRGIRKRRRGGGGEGEAGADQSGVGSWILVTPVSLPDSFVPTWKVKEARESLLD